MSESKEPIQSTPPSIESALSELDNENLPFIFKNQARTVANFIERLDAGKGLQDPDLKLWLNLLSRHYFSNPSSYPYAAELPPWGMPYRRIGLDGDEKTISELKLEYPKWVQNQGGKVENHGEGQDYFRIAPPDDIAIGPRRFKIYVEGFTLLSSMKDGRLTELLDKLRRANIPPASMKLYGNSALPMYFYQDIDRSFQATSVFREVGIKYRGPAQDVWIAEVRRKDRSGGLVDLYSNDQAMDTNYSLQTYSPGGLLQDYLKQICIPAGRSPINPYLTSFVWLIDRGREPLSESSKTRWLAGGLKQVGYPLVYKQAPL